MIRSASWPSAATLAALAIAGGGGAGSCARTRGERPEPPAADGHLYDARLAELRAFQAALSAQLGPGVPREGHGEDPWAIRPLGGGRAVGVLRGASAVALLGPDLRELSRVPGPHGADALAVDARGVVYVGGEYSDEIARFVVRGEALEALPPWKLEGALGVRDVALAGGAIYALDSAQGRVRTTRVKSQQGAEGDGRHAPAWTDIAVARGAVGLAATPDWLVVNEGPHRALTFVDLASGTRSRVAHDGPFWGVAALEDAAGSTVVVASGVEDHPLDRREGSFGFIDSFLTAFRVDRGRAREVATANASEVGIVVPKTPALAWVPGGAGEVRGVVAGGGSAAITTFRLTPDDRLTLDAPAPPPSPFPPGTRELTFDGDAILGANPLADSWVRLEGCGNGRCSPARVAITHPSDARPFAERLGEALVFTTLMAPWTKSDGRLSRFTCETCHFEGLGDGRVHDTGRRGGPRGHDEVFATTKPLFGLGNNAPFFTRAKDPDLASVAMNEFRVAGAKSDHDPWFVLDVAAEAPWLGALGDAGSVPPHISPEAQRQAFITFLAQNTHRPNPRAVLRGSPRFDAEEARGADTFERACEGCHQARMSTGDPASRVPRNEWEVHVLGGAPALVWARDGYEKTGVVPYVDEEGARSSSLRGIARKVPYFTTGAAGSLEAVVGSARIGPSGFLHVGGAAAANLRAAVPDGEAASLVRFLELL